MQWMVTPQLQNSGYLDSNAENMHMLVSLACHDRIISKELWNLFNHCTHFSDSRTRKRVPNFSEILFRYHILRQEYDALFHNDRTLFDQYIEIVNKIMYDIANDTYMNASKMN
jgi:hypothetical protein